MLKKFHLSLFMFLTLFTVIFISQASSTANADEVTLTSISDYNRAYDHTTSSFDDTADGFLTPDSWYRPKRILRGGTTWVKSTPMDKRPLLMAWWPDKTTKVNYLNFMNGRGFGTTPSWHTTTESNHQLAVANRAVQVDIEKKISKTGSVQWLKRLMTKFVNSQSQWNIKSEGYDINDGFQGGALLYGNNKNTPWANSKYRIINRFPNQQTGKYKYYDDGESDGNEFLLANDVDNSNPVVQSEDLNWVYYLTHFGDITKHDSNANFDGIRFDAVDNVDADLLNIMSDYFKQEYQVNKNDQNAINHLSILEDWAGKDPNYVKDHGNNQLTMDSDQHFAMINSLALPLKQRMSMQHLNDYTIIPNRSNDTTQNSDIPNYSFMRAHDSGVQEILFQIIKDKYDHNFVGGKVNPDYLSKALKVYDADEQLTNKKYTYYNIPSSYAFMLTNKDTVPRIYYGDMYKDDGQFMAEQSPYYESIDAMLEARVKYVAGGQQMKVQYGLLTSVRFGSGANTIDDKGNKLTRTSGIGVIIGNQPKLKLSSKDKITLNMGAAHKNQFYRPVVVPTIDGVKAYLSDADANSDSKPIKTNSSGQLILGNSQIKGYSNPQLSGYLSVWVPVGANNKQDVRTKASTKQHNDKTTFRSNAALDSQVIFEAFSNFQPVPTKSSDYENVVLPKKVNDFKRWGITYMQLPPQYRSVSGNSFVDATVQNGYAFNDRYDLGYGSPTKYGTASDLANTIETFHNAGIKSLADFVPNQLYDLPGKQVVSATRVDVSGKTVKGTKLVNRLYLANSRSSKNTYQYKYGGAFLKLLHHEHPNLFSVKQVSNGKRLVYDSPLRIWSAKYLNGSNIQGRGINYVLRDSRTHKYYLINNNHFYLPVGIK
ncbi:glycoside hydrolase family 70 protein [Lactobacillus sp. Sy-1]|uniref:glycoside hydrolase family 70 protein n=1 Tax=Lactobacillus sp. Sy-1 TaxID=2109645 RepID=UPI001C56F638|nr:glycoside hydrolase family 70 protein [Lactobacillus sp. Sy-1]MBW1604840.1 hydrolase [Lactobacillus sp. Sy-1]